MTALESATAKLEPIRTSGKFRAILGYILGQEWTNPQIDDMCITSDGCLLAQHEGDYGMNDLIGAACDLHRNIEGICSMANLSADERQAVAAAVMGRIKVW